jgi:hypothetical protein
MIEVTAAGEKNEHQRPFVRGIPVDTTRKKQLNDGWTEKVRRTQKRIALTGYDTNKPIVDLVSKTLRQPPGTECLGHPNSCSDCGRTIFNDHTFVDPCPVGSGFQNTGDLGLIGQPPRPMGHFLISFFRLRHGDGGLSTPLRSAAPPSVGCLALHSANGGVMDGWMNRTPTN